MGVPSRTEVAEYRDLGSQVNELVGRINGNYGTLEYSPVHYINQSITQVNLSRRTHPAQYMHVYGPLCQVYIAAATAAAVLLSSLLLKASLILVCFRSL